MFPNLKLNARFVYLFAESVMSVKITMREEKKLTVSILLFDSCLIVGPTNDRYESNSYYCGEDEEG